MEEGGEAEVWVGLGVGSGVGDGLHFRGEIGLTGLYSFGVGVDVGVVI